MIPHNKPTIGNEEIKAVANALYNLELTMGTKVKEFEKAFSKYIGINAAATSSGTSALHLALIAIGVSKNDEVIIPSYTCVAVAFPVLYQQAKPILADVNDDYNISVEDIRRKITEKTKAVIVPHMFGYPANLNAIKELCEENNIYLIEDCAQSISALYHNKKVGTIGDISIFSFYATKMMTTIQGGMVCARNSEWTTTIKELRDPDQYRSTEDDLDTRLKYRYTMSDVGAAVGIIQLKKLNHFINRRREIASIYRKELENMIHPIEKEDRIHVYSRYIIRTPYKPNMLIGKLQKRNIVCAMMHVPPLHRRALLKKFNSNAKCPKTEEIVNSAISLPIYPSLTDVEVIHVVDILNRTIEGDV